MLNPAPLVSEVYLKNCPLPVPIPWGKYAYLQFRSFGDAGQAGGSERCV